MNTDKNNTQSSQSCVRNSAFNYIDYLETLAEELILNGFNVKVVEIQERRFVIQYDAIFGIYNYKTVFNDFMKDYYRFIMCYGMKLHQYGLEKHLSIR